MRELKTIIKIFFKKNFFNAKIYPIITAKKEDTIKAVRLTFKDKIIISNNKEIPKVEVINDIKESEINYWYVLTIIPIFSIIAILMIRKSRFSANNK